MNKENNIIDLEWLEYAKQLCERGLDKDNPLIINSTLLFEKH